MTSLTTFNNNQQFTYDWELIEDESARNAVKNEIAEYQKAFNDNRKAAETLITNDLIARAKCVYEVKEQLPHGQYREVCQVALGVGRTNAAALLSIHTNVMSGSTTEDILETIRGMGARAAADLLKAEPEVQKSLVGTFQETGKVPTQRDIKKTTSANNEWRQRQESQARHTYNYQNKLAHAFDKVKESVSYEETPMSPQAATMTTTASPTVDTNTYSEPAVPELEIQTVSTIVSAPEGDSDIRNEAFDAMHAWLRTKHNWTEKDHSALKSINIMIQNYFPHIHF